MSLPIIASIFVPLIVIALLALMPRNSP